MKYDIVITNQCKKDIKLAKKQGKDIGLLFEVADLLSEGKELEARYRDHPLSGNYKGKRECHLEPDFLLIYEKKEREIVLFLIRVGSHSELFE